MSEDGLEILLIVFVLVYQYWASRAEDAEEKLKKLENG